MLGAMHAGAFAIIWLVPAGVTTRIALTLLVAASLLRALLAHARLPQSLPPGAAIEPSIVSATTGDETSDGKRRTWQPLGAARSWRRWPPLLAPPVVDALEWNRDGNWSVRFLGSTQWHPCELRERWLQPWLVILRLRDDSDARTWSVLVVRDAVAPDAFRRLRARLRLQTEVG